MIVSKTEAGKYLARGYTPNDTDIVCGRGKGFSKQYGNKAMLAMIHSYINDYSDAPTQREKNVVGSNVVKYLLWAGLRFLKYDATRKQYFELGSEESREEICKTIRELIIKQDKKKSLDAKRKAVQQAKESRAENDKCTTETDCSMKAMHCSTEYDSKQQMPLPVPALALENAAWCGDESGTIRHDPKQDASFDFNLDHVEEDDWRRAAQVFFTDTPKETADSPLPLDSNTQFECQDIKLLWDSLAR